MPAQCWLVHVCGGDVLAYHISQAMICGARRDLQCRKHVWHVWTCVPACHRTRRHAGPASEVTASSTGEAACAENAAQAAAAIKPQHKLLPDVCRTADILVVAVGHAELVRRHVNWHLILIRVAAG